MFQVQQGFTSLTLAGLPKIFIKKEVSELKEELIQKLDKDIEYLKELKKELENQKRDFQNLILDYYEVPYHEEVIDFLYTPKIVTEFGEGSCNKCKDLGFVKAGSDKDLHFVMCDCFYSHVKYTTQIISVRSIIDSDVPCYLCYDGKDVFRVPCEDVLTTYDDSTIKNYTHIFYKNQEDCDMFCKEMNKELRNE